MSALWVAYHEAGHAVAGVRKVVHLSIIEDCYSYGRCKFMKAGPLSWSKDRPIIEAEIRMSLCGPEAERKFCGRLMGIGKRDDYTRVFEDSELQFESKREHCRWIRQKMAEARKFVEERWWQITIVASKLHEKKTLDADEIEKIFAMFGFPN